MSSGKELISGLFSKRIRANYNELHSHRLPPPPPSLLRSTTSVIPIDLDRKQVANRSFDIASSLSILATYSPQLAPLATTARLPGYLVRFSPNSINTIVGVEVQTVAGDDL